MLYHFRLQSTQDWLGRIRCNAWEELVKTNYNDIVFPGALYIFENAFREEDRNN